MSTTTAKRYDRWGEGKIFSPLHRITRTWILCEPNQKQREVDLVKIFGSKRRRTSVMKSPSTITLAEVEALAALIGEPLAKLQRIAQDQLDPSLEVVIRDE